jgi:hypothetical protein
MLHATFSGASDIAQSSETPSPVSSFALVRLPRGRLDQIAAEIEAARLLPRGSIAADDRRKPAAYARHEFMWRARELRTPDGERRFSWIRIAMWFEGKGGRTKRMDHTSVIYGWRKHAERRRAALVQLAKRAV